VSQFIRVFERDIAHGGLFVATQHPARLDKVVVLEVSVPTRPPTTVRVPARVVQRVAPSNLESERSRRTPGMGVEFVDKERAVAQLRILARRLS
jgi:Tfp pilus assembly protein PilZ